VAETPRENRWTQWLVGAIVVGCALGLWGGYPRTRTDFAAVSGAEVSRRSSVLPAVGSEDHGPAPIRLAADILKEPADAVKKGVNRLAQAVNPAPPVDAAEDPTSLRTKAKVSPELYIAAAQVHESAGRLAQAENAFQQAFRLAPRHLPTHLAYARFKDRQHQSREALEIYLRLAREFPNEAPVFNDLGLYYARRGMNQEAIAAFERAVQLQPNRQLYRNNLAVVLVQNDSLEAALAQLLAVYTEPEAYYKLGYLLQKKGDAELALQYFGRAWQLQPGMTEAQQWYEHLQRQLASRGIPEKPGRQELSFGPPPSLPGHAEVRAATRPAAPGADIAVSPSSGQRPTGETRPTDGPATDARPQNLGPLRDAAPVRQLPPMPRRLPSTETEGSPAEGAPADEEAPPMPPPANPQGRSPPSNPVQPAAKSALPDPPLPPVSRAVRLPSVQPTEVRRVPAIDR